MKGFIVVALILAVGIWAYNFGTMNPRVVSTNNTVVKSICDYSRTVHSGDWEEACGMAQDNSSTEYRCDSTAATARCWVEEK